MNEATVIAFPTPPTRTSKPELTDAEILGSLDAIRFQRGFDDASADVSAMPVSWARHHATTTLAKPRPRASDIDDEQASYQRGYRAGLYGFLRAAKHP